MSIGRERGCSRPVDAGDVAYDCAVRVLANYRDQIDVAAVMASISRSVLVAYLFVTFGARAQNLSSRPAEEVYRNIQVLKGTRASDVPVLMQAFNQALSVECSYCHVPDQWHLEEKPQFATARGMFRMVGALGDGLLKDRGGLTCWTCHRGQSKPSRFPGAELDSLISQWPASLANASDGLKLTMTVYARSLGVTCSYCHVPDDWKSAEKASMRTMPTMLAIFNEIPKYSAVAAQRSQCWMCHQGSTRPERAAKQP